MILSEGAGAVLLARRGRLKIESIHAGRHYRKRTDAETVLKQVLSDLIEAKNDFVIASANGTFVDQAECRALSALVPEAVVYTVKPALGESVGASGLWQVIVASQALRHEELPPLLHATAKIRLRIPALRMSLRGTRAAIVLSCGLNQQIAGLRLGLDG
jgi:3-oxoacyl-(acyl-carrier-protein) synthase